MRRALGRRVVLPIVCVEYDRLLTLPDSIRDSAVAVTTSLGRRGFSLHNCAAETPSRVVLSATAAELRAVVVPALQTLRDDDVLVVYAIGYGSDWSDGSVLLPVRDFRVTKQGRSLPLSCHSCGLANAHCTPVMSQAIVVGCRWRRSCKRRLVR
jgi:hypothetical protein